MQTAFAPFHRTLAKPIRRKVFAGSFHIGFLFPSANAPARLPLMKQAQREGQAATLEWSAM